MMMKLAIAMFVMAIVCTVCWEFMAAGYLYDCTDGDCLPGFLTPGDWVHDLPMQPVRAVDKVVHGRSMSEPDTIKMGWGVTGLWVLWCGFILVSVVISVWFAQWSGKAALPRAPL
jgi:hypothetical protein